VLLCYAVFFHGHILSLCHCIFPVYQFYALIQGLPVSSFILGSQYVNLKWLQFVTKVFFLSFLRSDKHHVPFFVAVQNVLV